ncbi:hypothetical protein G3A40_32635 [Paraburkholderia aspalathi]|uniref:hypothetical protein n=1 Tax=Paraburkholderia aspalathi TaxID=1324617 RepID=UPI00190AD891|nr:hypothetical protein [Paraburkholderia aspalathi]MBK3864522.1 hypothetical protein [Paraburkholderia aspalathi]
MDVLTTDTLPPNLKLVECLGFVSFTAPVEISSKGLIRGALERKRNEQQEAFDGFVKSAPPEANVLYGVKVSTAAAQFQNGSFLYVTFIGTAGRAEPVNAA